MAKYVYPAIFTPEESGYFIDFPDFESCYTQGIDIADGISMAEDVLSLVLTHYEDEHREIPIPSALNALSTESGAFATYISVTLLFQA